MFSTGDSINDVDACGGAPDTARSLKAFSFQDSSHCLESPGGFSNTLLNLNALSLGTPEQARISLFNVRAAGCPSPPAFLDDGLAHKRLLAKTSFTRYSGSPAVDTLPSSPLDSATRLRPPVTMGSPDGSAFSSPKPTSCTLLGHGGRSFSTPTSVEHRIFSQSKSVPRVVDEQDNLLLSQSNGGGTNRLIDGSSMIEEHRGDKVMRPSGTHHKSKRSPGQILPQVYLTPRSSGILISSLTRFPSPPKNDEMSFSFFSSASEREGTSYMKDINDEKDLHQEAKPHSLTQDTACSTLGEEHDLIYLPDISRGMKHEFSVEYSLGRCKSQLKSGSRPRSRSLLNRSRSNSPILAELSSADYGRDGNESLSCSDEEEAFFLVAPSCLRSNKFEEDLPHKRIRDQFFANEVGNSFQQSTYAAPAKASFEVKLAPSTMYDESSAAKRDSSSYDQLSPPCGDTNSDQLSYTCVYQKAEAGT
ncbi:hypothetical protein FisN_12Hu366 [Fistulifera solaris]|uniref:Uncharacterized protein n=1 Tax=Fistulifera solaris TaxID=1519565 RepID=A0A1Z5KCY7_FISSO|nr:hypothetical protein FisN_12Hu366 [Fistulifera solaris]|eukprot:GAX23788.1 hypothetical protein FisN_12Hu366 [Fistulifera solaris]